MFRYPATVTDIAWPALFSEGFNCCVYRILRAWIPLMSIRSRELFEICNSYPRRRIDVFGFSTTLSRTASLLTFEQAQLIWFAWIFQLISSHLMKLKHYSDHILSRAPIFVSFYRAGLHFYNPKLSAVKLYFLELPALYCTNADKFKSSVNPGTPFICSVKSISKMHTSSEEFQLGASLPFQFYKSPSPISAIRDTKKLSCTP